VGNRLQEKRLALELTQPQVSARLKEVEPRADVGMVSRYEKGVCLPTGPQLSVLEELYGAARTELYDAEDLDLLGALRSAESMPDVESEGRETAPPPSHAGRFRKCYRISREFAESLPDDLLQVCGYSSWQSWHDAALKRLVGEYAARCKAAKKGGQTHD
jgi:transcriptional regulator with XRE-family HTH domain